MSDAITTSPASHISVVAGRRIAYEILGEGTPVFFFHGSPSSRLEGRSLATAASAAGFRLIALDRPGMGASDPQPGRRLIDWPPIVEALSRELSIERFSVIGYSTGALYAHACAFALPDRVLSSTIISGTGTPELMRGWNLGWLTLLASRAVPSLGRSMFGSVAARARRDPDTFEIPGVAPVDRDALKDPENRRMFLASFAEAFAQGADGVVQDQVLVTQPWGFDVSAIRVPTVFWHGTADRTVPARVATAMSARIPQSAARLLEGEGHVSLLLSRAREIFSATA
jgi:pimeloyl-ACP methyl ester carboxylesterase